ncbi:MAG: diaminopimelate decarboxylase [Candidatus Endonucleobacter bathymodioli]|uniref:Diaminopimelate decarboxylase n=1 Tax=Candidatus Endonucleibacter bathymodioli TaxID=539814 RepID=A0AA90NKD9_9GAMM|nr:diaminopimelate decarboxylase [Candidatus Endonucleobacter bathymodioli]
MNGFSYFEGEMMAEELPVASIAEQFGTPLYIYSKAGIEAGYWSYEQPLAGTPHFICYAVKANSNLAVLNVLARMGSGFDIVSVGELERVIAAGGNPNKIVFSGVGKQIHEIQRAIEVGIHCFNVESKTELQRIQSVAQSLDTTVQISLRVNPDIDAQAHPYISTGLKNSKFGIDINQASGVYKEASTMPNIRVIGIGYHIGSQIMSKKPLLDALDRVLVLVDQLKKQNISLQHIDIGGGLGVKYKDEVAPAAASYLCEVLKKLEGRKLTLIVEPGRFIAAEAGILLTRVELIKHAMDKSFAIVDAAMNDLLRPSIYDAWHAIDPVQLKADPSFPKSAVYDIVGPICETGDFLGKGRVLQLQENDLLAIRCAGAYGFVMSSNYNSRNRSAEVMVSKDKVRLIRRRETIEDQIALEKVFPET